MNRTPVFLLTLALGLSSCAKKDPSLEDIVARYGEDPITRSELIAMLKELPPRIQSRYATQEGLAKLLEENLDRRAQAEAALKMGLDKDPVVKDKIATYIEQKTSALDQQIQSLKEQRRALSKTAIQDILSAELFDLRIRGYQSPLEEGEVRAAYAEWKSAQAARDPKFKAPPYEVVRRDLILDLIKRKVRDEIRREAGVTILLDKLANP